MTQPQITTKAELLARLDREWRDLQAVLGQFTAAQMTVPPDPQGWTVKDHVIHLMAWERTAVFFLQSKPRHEGLGVDEAVFWRGNFDEINDIIYRRTKDAALADVLADFRQVHQDLLALIAPLDDDALRLSYRHYLPSEPHKGDDGPPALYEIYVNSAGHYAEHLPWMQTLAGAAAPGQD